VEVNGPVCGHEIEGLTKGESMAFFKSINWRKVASAALAAAFVAVVHALAPSLAAVSVPAAAALVHYVDAWGSKQSEPSDAS
jgi:hypothetical protein